MEENRGNQEESQGDTGTESAKPREDALDWREEEETGRWFKQEEIVQPAVLEEHQRHDTPQQKGGGEFETRGSQDPQREQICELELTTATKEICSIPETIGTSQELSSVCNYQETGKG